MEKFGSGINIPDPQHSEDLLLFHHLKIFSGWLLDACCAIAKWGCGVAQCGFTALANRDVE
jgi:hypothetical protein